MRALLPLLILIAARAAGAEPLSLAAAVEHPGLTLAITAGPHLSVSAKNASAEPVTIAQPAGLILREAGGDAREVTLRAFELIVPANGAADASVPAAPLHGVPSINPMQPTAETEPRLAPLLGYLATHNDVPRLTAQLLTRCVIDDVGFAAWQHSLSENEPAPEQIVAAIDALGVLRQIEPNGKFALATDAELKLRALRNPVTRGKAMQLYGIALPEAPLPPELGSLLHTKPGDNCPICRQRALMLPREDGL